MQYGHNKGSIDILAAAGAIFKDLLGLKQVGNSLWGLIVRNRMLSKINKAINGGNELIFVKK